LLGGTDVNVIVSPHLDDAALSLGQFLAAEPAQVVTMFAGIPTTGGVTDYDRSCGFDSSATAMERRRDEDSRACFELGATPTHLGFLDLQYRDEPPDIDELARVLHSEIRQGDEHMLYVPIGLGHPDHRIVSDAALQLPGTLAFYEELPYRVLHPEQVHERLDVIRETFKLQDMPLPLPAGDRATKARAIGCYRSQFPNGADDPCLLVPERVWLGERCA
jgi:LmbE family N-acetylglucosaminyl deacetylase